MLVPLWRYMNPAHRKHTKDKLDNLDLLFVITTSTLTFRTSAKSLLWACCPVSRLGKVLAVGLHCSPSVLGKRCKVVKTTSLLRLLLHGPFLRSHGPAVLQPSLTSPWSNWPFPLLSIPFADLALAKAESCNAPSPSSLFGLSSSSALSLSSSFSCSSEPSGLSRPRRSLWWTCMESCQEDTQCLYRLFLLWHSQSILIGKQTTIQFRSLWLMQCVNFWADGVTYSVLGSNACALHYCGVIVIWLLFSVIGSLRVSLLLSYQEFDKGVMLPV